MSRRSTRASVSGVALLGLLAMFSVAGCTSGTTTGDPASRSQSTTTTGSAPTQAATTPTSAVTSPADASATARALVTSAVQLDTSGFQTGAFDPAGPAQSMPGTIQFTTPSKNIRCTMVDSSPDPSSLICTANHFDFTAPPKPASCHMNWTAYFSLGNTGVKLGLCLGGEEVSYLSRVLPYGDAIQALGIGCYSSSAALTCMDMATGHGFTVNRARFIQF